MRPDEFLFPVGEVPDLTQEELDALPPVDPEVALISDYLIKYLDADGMAEVERRLREDDGFRERVHPIMLAWQAWPKVSDFEVSEEEMQQSWRRLLRKAAWHDEPAPDTTDEQQGQGPWWSWPAHPRTRALIRQLRRTQLVLMALLVAALSASAYVGVVWWPQVQAPKLHSSDAWTVPGKPFRIGPNAWVTLSKGARLTWSDAATPNDERELYLEGSAYFRLPALASGQYLVITPSAYLRVLGANFDITSTNPAVTVVEVAEGRLMVQGRGAEHYDMLDVGPNDTALLTWAQAPRRAR